MKRPDTMPERAWIIAVDGSQYEVRGTDADGVTYWMVDEDAENWGPWSDIAAVCSREDVEAVLAAIGDPPRLELREPPAWRTSRYVLTIEHGEGEGPSGRSLARLAGAITAVLQASRILTRSVLLVPLEDDPDCDECGRPADAHDWSDDGSHTYEPAR